ncbi:hypothetical protein RB623_29235 [Mesorhizobium sp. LHD-90]|uniref:hypothetical protein n=1 Tax=Mesorhizobium sp. LHD-90 TaxID=3071414 RepID=UPI0027E1D8E9|nr:hypothetical protein [Mesorhizobium sp. LHD-90]MDQ6438157.1 hypothetical protein [Mesorhizobium sp. LHD-90]
MRSVPMSNVSPSMTTGVAFTATKLASAAMGMDSAIATGSAEMRNFKICPSETAYQKVMSLIRNTDTTFEDAA